VIEIIHSASIYWDKPPVSLFLGLKHSHHLEIGGRDDYKILQVNVNERYIVEKYYKNSA